MEQTIPAPAGTRHDLVELVKLDPTIRLDIRYARSDNFVGRPVYDLARAFLQAPAARDLAAAHQGLQQQGLGLVVFDGYRPWSVTKLFWEVTPEEKRLFVANPQRGSRHNRGCAVDLSLIDLKIDAQLPMPSEFDEFTDRAFVAYDGGTVEETRNRDLLIATMETHGFRVNQHEWWHFDHHRYGDYPVLDVPFEALDSGRTSP